jgi:hypothetical protein
MLNRRRIFALLLAAAMTTALSLASAGTANAAAPLGPFQIQNFNDLCVQPNPADTGPDIQVVQEPCAATSTVQQWLFWSLGGADWHIQNVATHNCLRALSNTDFAAVDTIDCTNITNEKWTINNLVTLEGPYPIISRVGGGSRCLDVFQDSNTPGTPIDIFHCTSNNFAQIWFTP